MEYELLHNCLANHFKQCTKDYLQEPKRHWNDACRDVYKEIVKMLKKDGILQNTQNFINSQRYDLTYESRITVRPQKSSFMLSFVKKKAFVLQ
jgi:hypothetical protein